MYVLLCISAAACLLLVFMIVTISCCCCRQTEKYKIGKFVVDKKEKNDFLLQFLDLVELFVSVKRWVFFFFL